MSKSRISDLELVARGRTADIFAWHDDQILKLFHPGFDHASIVREVTIARAVAATGLPVPAVGDIVTHDGREGIIYERLHGRSMLQELEQNPAQFSRHAALLGELQAKVHTTTINAKLPALRDRLDWKIRHASALHKETKERAVSALASMPEGDRLCHGDFHPANILLTRKGPYIIDWIDATVGNPLADVARTSVIIQGDTQSTLVTNPLLKVLGGFFHRVYLDAYRKSLPDAFDQHDNWIPIVAAARLSENIPQIEKWLLSRATQTKSFHS